MNHTAILYAIGLAALVTAGASHMRQNSAPRTVVSVAPGQPAKAARNAWPDLGQDKTIALGEALQGFPKTKLTIYCADPECDRLAHDLDDAMQIADIQSDFERGRVDAESSAGIFVGPPGEMAGKLVVALRGVGLEAVPVEMPGPIGIIIGKRQR